MAKKETYEAPQTQMSEVELEQGFMNASVFAPEDGHDDGVSIEGHGFGSSVDYFEGENAKQWDNTTTN